MTRSTPTGWKVVTRAEAVVALRMMVACTGRNPAHFALHSGRIGGTTQLVSRAGDVRTPDPTRRPLEVASLYGLRHGGGGGRRNGVGGPRPQNDVDDIVDGRNGVEESSAAKWREGQVAPQGWRLSSYRVG